MLGEYQELVDGGGLTQHLGCVLDRRKGQGSVAAHAEQDHVAFAIFTQHRLLALSDVDCAKTPSFLRAGSEDVIAKRAQ